VSKAGELARLAARRQVRRRLLPLVLGVAIVPLTGVLLSGWLLVPVLLPVAFALGYAAGGRRGAGTFGDSLAFLVGMAVYATLVALGRDFGVTPTTSVAGFVSLTVAASSLAYAVGTSTRRSRPEAG
jgi:hypothetical protein